MIHKAFVINKDTCAYFLLNICNRAVTYAGENYKSYQVTLGQLVHHILKFSQR